MANLFDYLKEHGNVPFREAPLGEADCLALCQLVYCDLSHAVPPPGSPGSVPVERAWRSHAGCHGAAPRDDGRLLRELAQVGRFGSVRLFAFEERFDPQAHEQFAAVTALLPDGTAFVAFRGTNHHISGWRENFMMSYEVVAAQRDARRYLEKIARLTSGPIHVGGHSKGGNLAAYAAAFCEPDVRGRIVGVWCFDSPGFVREVVDFEAFDAIAGRLRLFVPEFCVVAGIMEQVVRPTVICSDQRRHLQHDALSWQVEERSLVRADALSPDCRVAGRVFHRLVYSRSRRERVRTVNSLFDAISLSGAETVGDLVGDSRVLARLAERLRACGRGTCAAAGEVLVGIAAAAVSLPAAVTALLDYPHLVPALVQGAGALSRIAKETRSAPRQREIL